MGRQHIRKNRADHVHGFGRQESAHQEQDVIEEIAKRQRSENGKEKNEPWKYGKDKEIRQRSRYLQVMMAHDIAVSSAEGLRDTADAHRLTIVSEATRVNTEMTICRRLRRLDSIPLLSGVVYFHSPHLKT